MIWSKFFWENLQNLLNLYKDETKVCINSLILQCTNLLSSEVACMLFRPSYYIKALVHRQFSTPQNSQLSPRIWSAITLEQKTKIIIIKLCYFFFLLNKTMYWPSTCIYMFVFIPNGNLWEKARSFTFDTHFDSQYSWKAAFWASDCRIWSALPSRSLSLASLLSSSTVRSIL